MDATHFLTRTIEWVSTEMSLHVLAYNLKRFIKLPLAFRHGQGQKQTFSMPQIVDRSGSRK
jgi:hypothetical protein